MWETVIDVAFLGLSIKEYLNNPSTETFLYVVWDGVANIMPYVPGSYVARGMNRATKSEISAELAKQGIRLGTISSKTGKSGVEKIVYKSQKKNIGRYKKAKNIHKYVHLAESSFDHALKEHMPLKFAQQLKHLPFEQISKKMKNKTFFNKSWSQEKICAAIEYAYNNALQDAVLGKKYSIKYSGETITVVLSKSGKLSTAYGNHRYTVNELKKDASKCLVLNFVLQRILI